MGRKVTRVAFNVPEIPKKKNVAAYCRVSSGKDAMLHSLAAQVSYYSELIQSHGEWEYAGVYADEAKTGTKDTRENFVRLLSDCRAGKIDLILTKSISRFARNTVTLLETVRELKLMGVDVYFEEQNIHSMSTDGEFMLTILASYAQEESRSASENQKWRIKKNFEEGKPWSSTLLGYRNVNGRFEIVPEEAAIVERIFEMFLAGQPVGLIAQMLQSENIEIPGKDLSFSKNMIMNILRNEKYCGDSILQKTVTVDCISKTRKANHGEAPMYLVENSHPAIISRDIFHRTQEELARRKALRPKSDKMSITQSGKYSKYALSEVLHCAECGSRYKRVTWNIRGKRKIVWRCVSRLDYGKKYCKDSVTLEEAALHRSVCRALNRCHAENEATYLTLMKSTIGQDRKSVV